jgi:hypothetical protein
LGYEPDAKAYRIVRERDNRVIVSRDVIVDERLAVAEKAGVEIEMGMEEETAEAICQSLCSIWELTRYIKMAVHTCFYSSVPSRVLVG